MTRRVLVLGFIVAAGALGVVVAQQPPLGKIEKIADGLYRIPGQGGATAVYEAANGVVLVDTKLANNGEAITVAQGGELFLPRRRVVDKK